MINEARCEGTCGWIGQLTPVVEMNSLADKGMVDIHVMSEVSPKYVRKVA